MSHERVSPYMYLLLMIVHFRIFAREYNPGSLYRRKGMGVQQMWFRAVATAMAVWCASGAAMANGYTEVWNPPQAGAHAGRGAAKGQGASGARTASKANTKIAAKHAAASAPAGRSKGKEGVKHAATRPGHESAGAVHDAKQKRAAVAHADKSHTEAAKTAHAGKSAADSSKAAHADAAQAGAAHGGAMTTGATAKGTATQPTPAVPAAPARADQADAAANPATARSGSLPPILH
ncbi:hypothetical protein [Paraburkholderia phenoliruptrix]|uniref:hypothetical protein n=1 Tax=Paraburkholderia phenoliruptrix TaxID=252970 RepID=UPI002869902C|nr:hypothetical protein [Paraburkholderia phenoliruptrix]WMY11173.1 hypothetical protein P3F88_31470 [Paraburkholderia phenoliruptrix]